MFALALPTAAAAPAAPLAGLKYLVGTWKCTYRGGGVTMAYDATYAYDLDGQALRQISSWAGGGGDEELVAYDARHHRWTAVVFDGQGTTTIMHATGSNPNHVAYRSVYPDTSLAVTYARVSASKYLAHGTFQAGGKTITSVDTCLRAGQ